MGEGLIFKKKYGWDDFHRVLKPVNYDIELPSYAIMLLSVHKKVFVNDWNDGKLEEQGDDYMIFYNQEGRVRSRPVTDPDERNLVIAIAWPEILK